MTGIGVMSGTSLDGIDISISKFSTDHTFEVLSFKAITYPNFWREQLKSAHLLTGLNLLLLENRYSEYLAELIMEVLAEANQKVDFIACHGHTIFHQPAGRLTYQMANGGLIAQRTGITTICDFRRGDVAQYGQGAPLVPIGDHHLFGQYSGCLNLGGFANLSYSNGERRVAYDISPANIVLNYLAERIGSAYDMDGQHAKNGTPDRNLLEKLNQLPYYSEAPPKSLGREWVEGSILPLLENGKTEDLLSTCTLHIAAQVAHALNTISRKGEILVTGGGAFNTHLIDTLKAHTDQTLYLPQPNLINGKEAIIFAYLGYLRIKGEVNILSSVTGGKLDICGGAIYLGT